MLFMAVTIDQRVRKHRNRWSRFLPGDGCHTLPNATPNRTFKVHKIHYILAKIQEREVISLEAGAWTSSASKSPNWWMEESPFQHPKDRKLRGLLQTLIITLSTLMPLLECKKALLIPYSIFFWCPLEAGIHINALFFVKWKIDWKRGQGLLCENIFRLCTSF